MYTLLVHHVACAHVSSVIKAVLNYASLSASRLPSPSSVSAWNVERLRLAQQQIAEQVSLQKNLCLQTDETSKYGSKIMSIRA